MTHRFYRIAIALVLAGVSIVAIDGCSSAASIVDPIVGARYSSIQANIFSTTCATAGCHQGTSGQAGLNLSVDGSYENLVNVNSSEVPSLKRVNPNNPDDSYLVIKLEGSSRMASGTVRMPATGNFLSTEQIKAVRDWIAAGAKND